MTYFELPADREAHMRGMTLDAYADMVTQMEAETELMLALGFPNLDPEDRPVVSEGDMESVTERDRADLQWVLDWEAHER